MMKAVQKRYVTKHGVETLVGSLISRGGEGRVYEVQGRSYVAVKVYSKKFLDEPFRARNAERKVEALIRLSRSLNREVRALLALPIDALHDEDTGDFRGFTMVRYEHSVPLNQATRQLTRSGWRESRPAVARVLQAVAEAIEALANNNIHVGDLKPDNTMVDLSNSRCRINLIDTASLHIPGYPGDAATAAYLPSGMATSDALRIPVRQRDAHALTVMAFEALIGAFPFQHIGGGPTAEDDVIKGVFPYQAKLTVRDRISRRLLGPEGGPAILSPPKGPFLKRFQLLPVSLQRTLAATLSRSGACDLMTLSNELEKLSRRPL
ncbi:MAG: serine/threonine-protein kinase [Cyanobacteria bacterium J06648_11]